ncbi:hypothetical protein CERZMDRAFT_83590 [Cercospora zeae-maydis SCOH1-5]|uniref:Uncharacterized protein n=1 Tax=Cercospora zeae-maydis SCOH1-5 TaxID=717836 RepID=A0A6A6FJ01_9PEZI|nr:hypothetical protein CERZMDRAFT_83590 [Cercospora zeae-maydis SCOH1-5]
MLLRGLMYVKSATVETGTVERPVGKGATLPSPARMHTDTPDTMKHGPVRAIEQCPLDLPTALRPRDSTMKAQKTCQRHIVMPDTRLKPMSHSSSNNPVNLGMKKKQLNGRAHQSHHGLSTSTCSSFSNNLGADEGNVIIINNQKTDM